MTAINQENLTASIQSNLNIFLNRSRLFISICLNIFKDHIVLF